MTSLTVCFGWQRAGRDTLDASEGLVFPVLPTLRGVYCFWIESSDPRPGDFVGEARIA